MATSHETEHSGGGHPTLKQYIVIAILLFAITIVEFVIIMDFPGEAEKIISQGLGQPSTTILLFLLSAIKFAIVILFYMHLKFDNKFFFWTFVAGMTLALMVGLSLIGLFTAIKGGELRADDAPYAACAFDHSIGKHGDNVCPTPSRSQRRRRIRWFRRSPIPHPPWPLPAQRRRTSADRPTRT